MGLFNFYETDAINQLSYEIDKPNERYESKYLGTWSSSTDMDVFFNRFNHDTNYKDGETKLSLGNYVTINDGTYNVQWEIAGFDMEHNQSAADGTVYDNNGKNGTRRKNILKLHIKYTSKLRA